VAGEVHAEQRKIFVETLVKADSRLGDPRVVGLARELAREQNPIAARRRSSNSTRLIASGVGGAMSATDTEAACRAEPGDRDRGATSATT
jgi:N-acyl-D-aspartate/D-glutamate deacylase